MTYHGRNFACFTKREGITVDDLVSRCRVIVAKVTAIEGWPLSTDDQGELARSSARHLLDGATDAEIETVVRNYYHDGPLYEMMSRRGQREGHDYWDSYRQGFARLAIRKGVDFADCEDVANEAVGQALKAFSQFAFRGSLDAWLYRIAVNACNDWHKRRSRRAAIDTPLPPTDNPEDDAIHSLPAPTSERPEETILEDERQLILRTTLERMLSDRDLLILHYSFVEVERLDQQTGQPRPWNDNEIARLVGLAPASIPTIRKRIVQRLASDPDLKEVMIQMFGPAWFVDRSHPVRKQRRQASDHFGQGK